MVDFLVLGKLGQEDYKFRVSLGYMEDCLRKRKKKKHTHIHRFQNLSILRCQYFHGLPMYSIYLLQITSPKEK